VSVSRTLPALLLLALVLPASVEAAPPYDIVVSGLEKVEPSRRQARLDFVARELALTISAPPGFAVAALGMYEAELSFDSRVSFLNSRAATGESTSPWDDLVESGEAESVAFLPGITLRKGLPFSFEIGGRMSWFAGSRQFVVGGFGRWVPFGNWKKVPDIGIGMGYDGLIGNDQLELGVFHLDLSIGYTFKLNLRDSRPGTRFSPFGGYSYLQSHARPGVTVPEVGAVTGWAENAQPGVDPRSFRYHRGFVGMEVRGGGFAFRFAFDASFPRRAPVVAGLNVSIGLRF
jgi:hypothetical protein